MTGSSRAHAPARVDRPSRSPGAFNKTRPCANVDH